MAHDANNRFLLGAFDVRAANQLRRPSELCSCASSRYFSDNFARASPSLPRRFETLLQLRLERIRR